MTQHHRLQRPLPILSLVVTIPCLLLLCKHTPAQWNNPHHISTASNTYFGAFISAPKSLDPAKAYSSDETQFIAQIYEPPLQYHLLKRPYQLEPLTAMTLPVVTYSTLAKQQNSKKNNASRNGDSCHHCKTNKPTNVQNPTTKDLEVKQTTSTPVTIYDITIKPGIYYQPHPAFAKDKQGHYRYLNLTAEERARIHQFSDLTETGTRELTAADYVYEIKRLASPRTRSPIFSLMSQYIVGFNAFSNTLRAANQQSKTSKTGFLDLRRYPLEGAQVISRYHYRIIIRGKYPQFIYWLAMPFFAPVPWEADQLYSQPGMLQKNITFDWQPVGTGAYYLSENNPNQRMVLQRNPNFHAEFFPTQQANSRTSSIHTPLTLSTPTHSPRVTGNPTPQASRRLPFIDRYVFSLDKESLPRWNKFLQGYYDRSGISADSFDQAIKLDTSGKPQLSASMKTRGLQLTTTVEPAIYYLGFNMMDSVVGGYGTKQRKLRQAIAIAMDYEEFVSIFLNGRGKIAHGPIPPSIFGYQTKQINPVVYVWQQGQAVRKPIAVAKQWLAEAGYPGGIDPKTKKPLILNYDVASTGSPDDQAQFNWFRKQFAKLGIELNIRSTQYNRFRDKVRTGHAQLFSWGWIADYPDPENFLFLLFGPNGKVKHGGENASNYNNPQFDTLYREIKHLSNGPERQHKINQALGLIQEDTPWLWGYHPIQFTLSHQWNIPLKPNAIAHNTFKYQQLNGPLRHKRQQQWNPPILWPLWLLIGLLMLCAIPLIGVAYRRERRPPTQRFKEPHL